MRRFDRNKHIAKANLLIEERYLNSKGFNILLTETQVDKLLVEVDTKDLLNEFNEMIGGGGRE